MERRLNRRDFLRTLAPLSGALGLSGCVAVFSRHEERSEAATTLPPTETPRPSLTPEADEKHPLVELFERLGLSYDGRYFSDPEGNKFIFEGFERKERVEGTCPERIIIELKGEPCETPTATTTPTNTPTKRVQSPTPTTERRITNTPQPVTATPEPPTKTPTSPPSTEIPPTMTPQPPTSTPPIPTPAPTNEDIIPTATQGS